MRAQHPVGALLKLDVKLTNREGTLFLYAHPKASFEMVSIEEARRFIDMMHGQKTPTHAQT